MITYIHIHAKRSKFARMLEAKADEAAKADKRKPVEPVASLPARAGDEPARTGSLASHYHSTSSSDDIYSYVSQRSIDMSRVPPLLRSRHRPASPAKAKPPTPQASEDAERSDRLTESTESERQQRRDAERRKLSRKNSSLLDKILLTNASAPRHDSRQMQDDMFYREPSANYLGAFE
jgi:hypothetical protein